MQTAPRPSPWSDDAFTNPFESPPTAPSAPVVEVRGCADCPMARGVSYSRAGTPRIDCRLAGTLAVRSVGAPDGCPLRSGPVTLRLVDRGRP